MKWLGLFGAAVAGSLAMTGAQAQTDVTGSSNTPSGVKAKPGAMTIRQASGGGKPHAPRTGRQPTARAAHPSAGVANRAYGGGTHATTSKGMSGVSKSPTRPATAPARH